MALLLALATLAFAGCSGLGIGGAVSSASATPASKAARPTTTAGVTKVNWSAPLNQPNVPTSMQLGFTSAPSNPQIAYACVGSPVTQTNQQRLFKTVDGEQTWESVSAAPNPGLPCRVFIDPTNADDIFLQEVLLQPTGDGDPISASFWRSQDGGARWTQLTLPPHSYGWRDLIMLGQRLVGAYLPVIFGAGPCNNAIFQQPVSSELLGSDDGGHTWAPLGQRLASQRISLNGLVAAGTRLFASGQTPQTSCDQTVYNTYWQSTDAGATWTAAALPTNTNIEEMSFTAAANGKGYLGITVEQPPVSDTSTTGAPYTVLISDDSGATWRAAPTLDTQHGAPVTSFNAQFLDLARTPAGDAVVAVQFLPGSSASSYLYLLRLRNGAPGWFQYTPGNVNYELGWQIFHGAQSDILQVTGYDPNQSHTVATVPLPA